MRITLALFVLITVPVSWSLATQPGVYVGNSFEESFADGFDHPAQVTDSANLQFENGAARFLPDGLLEYTLLYDPVETRWGTNVPGEASFEIWFWDENVENSSLHIEFVEDDPPYEPGGPRALVLRSEGTELVFEITGATPVELARLPRAPGWTIYALWAEVLNLPFHIWRDGSGLYEEWMPWNFWRPFRPDRLRIEGEGLQLDSVKTFTWTYVGTSDTSWGRLKSLYE